MSDQTAPRTQARFAGALGLMQWFPGCRRALFGHRLACCQRQTPAAGSRTRSPAVELIRPFLVAHSLARLFALVLSNASHMSSDTATNHMQHEEAPGHVCLVQTIEVVPNFKF